MASNNEVLALTAQIIDRFSAPILSMKKSLLIAYLHEEERNYEENPDERHIWLNIKPLKEWVEAERQKRRLGR